MPEVNITDFDKLINNVSDIKNEISTNKVKSAKKEVRDKVIQLVSIVIAIISFLISVYTIFYNVCQDTKNAKYQRGTKAYDYWLSYLSTAYQNPQYANGIDSIDKFPVAKLACRDKNKKEFDDTTVHKFAKYAWYVANALGTAEIVYELTDKDPYWKETIDSILAYHNDYITCGCFNKNQYDTSFQRLLNNVQPPSKKLK